MEYDYIAYTDGACGPINPGGKMGYGIVIQDDKNRVIAEHSSGKLHNWENTNNLAEFSAVGILFRYIENLIEENPEKTQLNILVKSDSSLVVNILSGANKIGSGSYTKAAVKCKELLVDLNSRNVNFTFKWIPRSENARADQLSKQGMRNTK